MELFTPGRIAFAISFVCVFALLLIWSYRSDKKERPAVFKGATRITISVLLLLILLSSLVKALKLF